MTQSILQSTKKILGIAPEYQAFDLDVLTHINSAFLSVQQLGVGPSDGFMIEDETAEWGTLLGGDPRLNAVKTYVFLRVRLLFDPPTTSFHLSAMQEQIKELEWRLMVHVDPPLPVTVPASDDPFADEPIVFDGGVV